MGVELYFLGSPRFVRDGAVVEPPSAKAIALLAYLAAAGRPQRRARLLALLWAESAEEAARKNLRNTLWTIRRALGEGVVDAGGDRIALSAGTWTDTVAFVRAATAALAAPETSELTAAGAAAAGAAAAIKLYGGPYLDGLTLAEAPDFEIWQTTERERLAQLYLRCLAALVDRYRESERWADLIGAAEKALAEDNLQEGMYRGLMEAYARLGDRPAALRQYDNLRSILARELGVDPLPETEALRMAVTAGELLPTHAAGTEVRPDAASRDRGNGAFPPGLRTTQAAQDARESAGPVDTPTLPDRTFPTSPSHTPAPPYSHTPTLPARSIPAGYSVAPPRRPAPFIGRTSERAVLDAELRAVAGGGVHVALITGDVGIGKSRLWQEWTQGLPPDRRRVALAAHCLESTRTLPYAPLAALLRGPALAPRLAASRSPVSPVWLAEVARLLPEVRAQRPDLPAPAPLGPEEERPRLFEAIVQCLMACEAQPLLLFIDDVHWADSATLDWLGYLAGRMGDNPAGLLLALSYRPDEAPAGLARLAAGWCRLGLARRLTLPPLDPAETAELARALGVDPLLAQQYQAQSAGNPYFLTELARAGQAGAVPPVLSELIRTRLERLSGQARQVLQAAAVLDGDFSFAILRRTSGRGEEEALDALDELLETGLLAERPRSPGESPAFSERDVTDEGHPAPAAAGDAEAVPAGGDAGLTFSHPLVAEVVRGSLSGARRAFLYRRAAEALEAVYSGRLAEVSGRLAAAYREAGELKRAGHFWEMAAEHALGLAAPGEAAEFWRQALAIGITPARQLGLGTALSQEGDLLAARASFEQALQAYLAQGERLGAARTCLELANSYLPSGRGDEVLRWAEKSLAYLDTHAHPEVDPVAHAQAHFLLGAGQLRSGGSLDEAEAQLAEAARLAEEKGLPAQAAGSRLDLGNVFAQRGDLGAAIEAYLAAARLARPAGHRFIEIIGYNNAAYHEMLAGDLPAARRDIAAAFELNEELQLAPPRQYLYSTRGEIALAEGHWDAAEEWLRRSLVEAERNGNHEQVATCQANLALAARGRGELDAALILMESACETAAPLHAPFLQAQISLRLAELHAQRGERAAASEALRQARAKLAGHGCARLEAWARRLGGEREGDDAKNAT